MHVTPTSLRFVGENPLAQTVMITGLTNTQGWSAVATDGIKVGPPASGVNDYPCSINVSTLKAGSSGTVTISAPSHEPVVVKIERAA
jgi:hypothetical protein